MSINEPATAIPDDLISPTEAAKLLKCHVASVYRRILDGTLPAWRMRGAGRKGGRKVSRADVLALWEPVQPKGIARRSESVVEKVAKARWLEEIRKDARF